MVEGGVKFAVFNVEKLEGTHIIGEAMDSKCDIEIRTIKIEDHTNPNDIIMVLSPLQQVNEKTDYDKAIPMMRFKLNDRYAKGLQGAPWKMIEHFEIFILPINFSIAKRFYLKIKEFLIPTTSLEDLKKDAVLGQKINMDEIIPKSAQTSKNPTPESQKKELPVLYRYTRFSEINLILSYSSGTDIWVKL